MTSIKPLRSEMFGLGRTILASAVGGALMGSTYALLAHMPVGQVTKAWAIWHAAQMALLNLTSILIKNDYPRMLMTTLVSVVSSAIGINEMQKRGFIGTKMIYFIVGVEAISTLFFCQDSF